MPDDPGCKTQLTFCSDHLPYPIARSCKRYLDELPTDPLRIWELISRDVLQSILHYLSHLLLADLIKSGEKPSHLFHHVQAILSRPMAGQYVGILRETARYFKTSDIPSSIPELIDFIYRSEISCELVDGDKALLGLLVDYRNSFAHGKITDQRHVQDIAHTLLDLIAVTLENIRFLSGYPLRLEDGTGLIGHSLKSLSEKERFLQITTAEGVTLAPLLIKLKGRDLLLLEDADISKPAMSYRGASSYHRFTKKQLAKGDPAILLEALKECLSRVRSVEALLPRPNWEDFGQRCDILTQRVFTEYEAIGKFDPETYIPRLKWEGETGLFSQFMASDKSLLAVSGGQGTGKSALTMSLARHCRNQGHAVLYLNAQRLTYAHVTWSRNPVPAFLATRLHYMGWFDTKGLKRLTKQAPGDKKIIVFWDAVNEVDSIKNKWNPFRALKNVLEWICACSHPNIKFIVSFRRKLYEDFDYLEPNWLPGNINAVGFCQGISDKPWIVDLEPFGEKSCKALYDRLQQLPERCMAPKMTWEQIRSGLGDNLGPYTGNPLLFSVFLMAHHARPDIAVSDEKELFAAYAGMLTGRERFKNWSWWKIALEFLKNGNITPKERFFWRIPLN